jgi:two-component system, LytTR family, sensor kinase
MHTVSSFSAFFVALVFTKNMSSLLNSLYTNQKLRLGLTLGIIYVPARIYMNVNTYSWLIVQQKLPLWFVELLVSALFFILWIYVIEWLQSILTGNEQLFELKVINQLVALVAATILATIFNSFFHIFWAWMESLAYPQLIKGIQSEEMRFVKRKANNALTVLALMAAYYLGIKNLVQERLKQVNVNSVRLEKENIRANLLALKSQISPHFLFNNLSVLSSLVETNREKSVEFLRRLSAAYRYILVQSDSEQIKLSTELDFLDTYMYLLNTRFENKIQLHVGLNKDQINQLYIVPLTLQLLVENAVKHNRMSLENPLIIRIYLERELLIVSNPLQKRHLEEPTTGLGLSNIKDRYRLLINKEVHVIQNDLMFKVEIPLLYESTYS